MFNFELRVANRQGPGLCRTSFRSFDHTAWQLLICVTARIESLREQVPVSTACHWYRRLETLALMKLNYLLRSLESWSAYVLDSERPLKARSRIRRIHLRGREPEATHGSSSPAKHSWHVSPGSPTCLPLLRRPPASFAYPTHTASTTSSRLYPQETSSSTLETSPRAVGRDRLTKPSHGCTQRRTHIRSSSQATTILSLRNPPPGMPFLPNIPA